MASYKAIINYDEEVKAYVASVPALPGCHTYGETREELLENVREAIQGYLDILEQDGQPIPDDVELEEVEVPSSIN